MLYRAEVFEPDTGAEAVVFLDTKTPQDATRWLHAHGFAVGTIHADTPPQPASSTPPAPNMAALTAAAEQIARSRLLRHPISTIAWGIVGALVLWMVLVFAAFILLAIFGALGAFRM